jgi:hypothetical protein
MSDDAAQFLKELEEQNGGEILYKTYALLIGRSGRGVQDIGGLLYRVGERLIFEDFERQQNSIMALINTKKPKYEKFKVEFPAGQLDGARLVMLDKARKVVTGQLEKAKIAEAGGLSALLGRKAVELSLNGGDALYFELFDNKGFFETIDQLTGRE